jgi:membrane-associated phospholipid phosphatase
MKRSKTNVAADNIVLGFSLALIVLTICCGDASIRSGAYLCAAVCVAAIIVPFVRDRSERTAIRVIYILYIMPALYLLYPTAIGLAKALHSHDFDPALIAIDRFLFGGVDPTRWISEYLHPPPMLVEVLQVCYFSHYLFPLILGAELAWCGRIVELEKYRTIMVYGAVLSFIGNMIVPAIGPRITLLEFADLQRVLPGVWVTNTLRGWINSGEGLQATMTSAEAMRTAFRDAFPSGHTMFTVMTILVAFQLRARVRWIIVLLGSGLICATLLLHYHYVIDVLAGVAGAVFVVWSVPAVTRSIGSIPIWWPGKASTRPELFPSHKSQASH